MSHIALDYYISGWPGLRLMLHNSTGSRTTKGSYALVHGVLENLLKGPGAKVKHLTPRNARLSKNLTFCMRTRNTLGAFNFKSDLYLVAGLAGVDIFLGLRMGP